ncbi:pheromone A receptor-domain-containing protein [Sparassis latifolia]
MDLKTFYSLTDFEIFCSFLGFILVCIPLWWHLEAWNMGCVLYIFWCGSQCLIQGINLAIWKDNVIDWAPVWCDITSRWKLASSIGVCCASLCINRRLYKISKISTVSLTRADKRRIIIIDLAIGLGIPIVAVALYWFYEGQRYDIVEGLGCNPDIPNTILHLFLITIWPIVIGLVSMVYCTLTLRAFWARRRQFKQFLSGGSNLSFNRYFRLMGIAATEMCFTVPFGCVDLYYSVTSPIYPWHGLADIHYQFSRTPQYPAVYWLSFEGYRVSFFSIIWLQIACAFIFFAFFGLADEARRHYRMAATYAARRLGLSTSPLHGSTGAHVGSKPTSSFLAKITIPSFIQRKTNSGTVSSNSSGTVVVPVIAAASAKHHSILSLSDLSHGDMGTLEEVKVAFTNPFSAPVEPSDELVMTEKPLPALPETRSSAIDISSMFRPTPDVPSPVRRDSYDIV